MHQVQNRSRERFTPADLVTCSRLVLTAAFGIVALTDGPRWLLGTIVVVALLTDFVDGRLARRSGTATPRGARLDQEADALLILVLSAVVAAHLHWWVLGIGVARYAFGALFVLVPSLRTPPARPRPWCRTVAATAGIVLAAVAVLPLPDLIGTAAAAVVAVLLAESFLHEAVDRWRAPRMPLAAPYATLFSLLAVWLVLVAPTRPDQVTAQGFLRLPLEVLVVVGLALLPWSRLRIGLAATLGVALGLLLVIKLLDLGFQTAFNRGFDPAGDWSYLGSGVGVLSDSIGVGWARAVTVLLGLAAVAILIGLPAAVIRLVGATLDKRRSSLRTSAVFLGVWTVCFAIGAQLVSGTSVASTSAASLVVDEVRLFRSDIADTAAFAREIQSDSAGKAAAANPSRLLSGLAGKDVLLVFVESYGRVAVQGTSFSPGIDAVLDAGTKQLDAAGYHSRSAFLTSPTFGGLSWLAHSTLESGLWVNSARRYAQLMRARRTTLTSLFGEAGWNTVFDVPADTRDWTQGRTFYRFAQYYDSINVGYRGPKFGYAPIPDQYTLAQFRRDQLVGVHPKPVFAEIDLVSSHVPWTPLPHLVPWAQVGDGSLYDKLSQEPDAAAVLKSPAAIQRMYGQSIQYTWGALTSFLTTYHDPNLVVIALGDHQPNSYVSGTRAGHDVPISVIAQDPGVISKIAGWGWQDGLHPSPGATVWRMDTFRNKFLSAFDG